MWITAFAAFPELEAIEKMCRQTHPDGRLTRSSEVVAWDERTYPAGMLICARKSGEQPAPLEPEKPI